MLRATVAVFAAGGIVERHHRSFTSELAALRLALRPADGAGELRDVVDVLAAQLHLHCALQEGHVFPAFERGLRCAAPLFEAWAMDALRLFTVVDVVKGTVRHREPVGLVARVDRLATAVHHHLVDEARVLSGWCGGVADLQR